MAAKKTEKTKTARKSGSQAASKTPGMSAAAWESAAAFAAKMNRAELPAKTRVHALAKQLGIASRQLVGILADQGVRKMAQSTLTPEQVGDVLDHIGAQAQQENTGGASKKADARKGGAKKSDAKKADAKKSAKKSTAKKAEKKTGKVDEVDEVEKSTKKTAKKTTKKSSDKAPQDPAAGVEHSAGTNTEQSAEKQDNSANEKAAQPEKPTRRRKRRATKKTSPAPAAQARKDEAAESTQASAGDEAATPDDAATSDAATAEADTAAIAEEKLRTRVRKNVANELSQIRDKVDAELSAEDSAEKGKNAHTDAAAADEDPEDSKLRSHVRSNVANEIAQIEKRVEEELAAEDDGFDDESYPVILPGSDDTDHADVNDVDADETESAQDSAAGEDNADADAAGTDADGYDYAPIFLAPTVDDGPTGEGDADEDYDDEVDEALDAVVAAAENSENQGGRRRRGRRGTSRGRGAAKGSAKGGSPNAGNDEPARDDNGVEIIDEPKAIRGSTRIEARRRRRAEMRDRGRERTHIVSQAEFLARRESVERLMVVRDRKRDDGPGLITQVGVLEDGLLVEHFVTSEAQASIIGNIYLGRVQNVLPSMEAAFVDIGTGRNGVLYAGDFDWRGTGLGGRARKIENALKSGDQVLVQVSKDPLGHKGARLTTQISLAGRFLVYVPKGKNAGISRKLPVPERKRLKEILGRVVPDDGGAIIRTAAENVSEEAIATDVRRLHDRWEDICATAQKEKESKGAKPVALYEEPDMLIKVVRDLFNEDFNKLIVDGKRAYNTVDAYVNSMAPDLADRVVRFDRRAHGGDDAFAAYRVEEQLHKALSRKVWLPSGGTLVIDRTEAMTVIDVNTGKFTGSGGNLEETVTKNNLEAAEEIVRQMRLRDLGGMIVVDFIDMVLPENQELVLRRLKEALGRDRTRHQVSEVTSLGLVQMTRKRLGTGLLETFSTECEHCHGRGIIVHDDPVDEAEDSGLGAGAQHGASRDDDSRNRRGSRSDRNDRGDRNGRKDRKERRDQRDHRDHRDRRDKDQKKGRKHAPHGLDDTHESAPSGANTSGADTSIEDLADSVIGKRGDDTQKCKRRGKKGSRNADAVSEIESIAHAAVETAMDAEKAEGGDDAARAEDAGNAQTYEEAVAEFERSPRRKRRTRGNSRSDRRPRPEDFEHADGSAADEADSRGDDEPAAESSRREDRPAGARRRRRRAVRQAARRARRGSQQDAADWDETGQEGAGDGALRGQRGGEDKDRDANDGKDASSRRRRGRRRATRSSRKGSGEQPASQDRQGQRSAAGSRGRNGSGKKADRDAANDSRRPKRRGRRRATRRD